MTQQRTRDHFLGAIRDIHSATIEAFPSTLRWQTCDHHFRTKTKYLPMMRWIFDITKYVVLSFSASEMECVQARLHLAYEVCWNTIACLQIVRNCKWRAGIHPGSSHFLCQTDQTFCNLSRHTSSFVQQTLRWAFAYHCIKIFIICNSFLLPTNRLQTFG